MNTETDPGLRRLPAIGQLLNRPEVQDLLAGHPAAVVTDALRTAVKKHRDRIIDKSINGAPLIESILEMSRR